MNKNIQIMIVDDQLFQLKMLTHVLNKLGIKNIQTFSSGLAALSWLKEHQADIIFCDLQMPDYDGIELLIALNHSNYTGAISIMSAMDETIIQSIESMCKNFSFTLLESIGKTYKQQELQSLLANIKPKPAPRRDTHQHIDVDDSDFYNALSNREIINYYQPQVDFDNSDIIGVEALARWQHPDLGLITPNIFIPIMEKNNLSHQLFERVLANVIEDKCTGKLPYQVSLNVDHHSLSQASFADDFLTQLAKHQLAPEEFTIEVTEREAYSNTVSLLKNLSRLRLNGVGVSIDDFGVGHSSLKKLSQLPFNEIKIDRSLIQDITHQNKHDKIVSFICKLAQGLQVKVVAEGVEDKATWAQLKEMDVDLCQGFYCYKPMPIEAYSPSTAQ